MLSITMATPPRNSPTGSLEASVRPTDAPTRAGREAAHAPHRRLALHAPPAVLTALRALPEALAEYERAAGHALTLTPGESGITDAE
jgi:hypothetical protein